MVSQILIVPNGTVHVTVTMGHSVGVGEDFLTAYRKAYTAANGILPDYDTEEKARRQYLEIFHRPFSPEVVELAKKWVSVQDP